MPSLPNPFLDKELTHKQKECIELLAAEDMTQMKMAELLEIAHQTICVWKRNRKFMEAVVKRSRELLKDSLPGVYKALTSKSKKGDSKHIKILLDHVESLEEIKASRANISFTWSPATSLIEDTQEDDNVKQLDASHKER